jgi:mannose-6-phosphate isomerase-like protein (cupin superfamily)
MITRPEPSDCNEKKGRVQTINQMNTQNLTIIDITQEAITNDAYKNIPVAKVNDHVVRMGVMTESYFWHLHPESDESFLVIEGSIFIDLEDRTVELFPNQLFTIPKNVIHRTRPNGDRSVNLTFESNNITTVRIENLLT